MTLILNKPNAAAHLGPVEGSLSRIDGKLVAIGDRLTAIDRKLSVGLWAVGINAAATIAILGVLLRHG
jgi:hypothetical protein